MQLLVKHGMVHVVEETHREGQSYVLLQSHFAPAAKEGVKAVGMA